MLITDLCQAQFVIGIYIYIYIYRQYTLSITFLYLQFTLYKFDNNNKKKKSYDPDKMEQNSVVIPYICSSAKELLFKWKKRYTGVYSFKFSFPIHKSVESTAKMQQKFLYKNGSFPFFRFRGMPTIQFMEHRLHPSSAVHCESILAASSSLLQRIGGKTTNNVCN